MSVSVAITSCNRPNLLRLTTEFLLDSGCDTACVYDDMSSSRDVAAYCANGAYPQKFQTRVCRIIGSSATYHDRAMRLALVRQTVVDDFLASGHEWLLLKDDDILVSWPTIQEAVRTYEFLRQTTYASDVGALTLHGLKSHYGGYISTNGWVFSKLKITGEACVLFHRDSLTRAGNAFGAVKGGFADTQFDALRRAGFGYYDRVHAPFQVQHLGYGPSASAVHRDEKTPFWNAGPFSRTFKVGQGEPVPVDGFDLAKFDAMARVAGGESAASQYNQ